MTRVKAKLKRMQIKLFSWEYWPFWLVYLPAGFYFVYLALKARSFFFFSAANPTIEHGGMLFESKWKIFQLIPPELYPTTVYVHALETECALLDKVSASKLKFPLIAKPDVGGRGFGVKKIHSVQELRQYRHAVKVPFLIQAYVDYPLELSVFYYRKPGTASGQITSVTVKELLSVTGDGTSTVDALIRSNNRAFLQYEKLKTEARLDLNTVLKKGEKRILVPYGNHVLGAMFVDYNHIVDQDLTNTFDIISRRIQGFYFGRYDIRCSNLEDLKKGRNLSILELNGAGAEPAHIYDPNFSYIRAQKVLRQYFKDMYTASVENHKRGVQYMTYADFRRARKMEKAYKQKIEL